jgi:hypothetical protein
MDLIKLDSNIHYQEHPPLLCPLTFISVTFFKCRKYFDALMQFVDRGMDQYNTKLYLQDTSKMRMTPDIQKQVLNSTNNEQNLPNGGETVAQEHESSFISSGDEQQYCLKWKFHQNNQQAMFAKLLKKESFCDVTIACEEKLLRAHKVCFMLMKTYFESNGHDSCFICYFVTFIYHNRART